MSKEKEKGISGVAKKDYVERVIRKMMVLGSIKRADQARYKELMISIRDKFALGLDLYLETLNTAYNLLETHSTRQGLTTTGRSRVTQRNFDSNS